MSTAVQAAGIVLVIIATAGLFAVLFVAAYGPGQPLPLRIAAQLRPAAPGGELRPLVDRNQGDPHRSRGRR